MSLKYFKLSQNILGSKRYWSNQNSNQLWKLPFYTFDEFLQKENLQLIELVKNNRNINLNNNQAVITFNSENEIFDYLIVEINGNKRYYYCDLPAKILNKSGAITLSFLLDKWMTYGLSFTKTLYENHQKVSVQRSQKHRYLRNLNGSIVTLKKYGTGTDKLSSIAQFTKIPISNVDWTNYNPSAQTQNGTLYVNHEKATNKFNANYDQLTNQKIYVNSVRGSLRILPGSTIKVDGYENSFEYESWRFTAGAPIILNQNFDFNSQSISNTFVLNNESQSNIRTLARFKLQSSTEKVIKEIEIHWNLPADAFTLSFNNVDKVFELTTTVNKNLSFGISSPNSSQFVVDIGATHLNFELQLNVEFQIYSNIETLGKENTYYIDENLQLELRNKEPNAETYIAENKLYNNDSLFENIADELLITHPTTLAYQFGNKLFFENDGSTGQEKTSIYLPTLLSGENLQPAAIKSPYLYDTDNDMIQQTYTKDVNYVDIFKQDDNTYKYVIVGAIGKTPTGAGETRKKDDDTKNNNQLYYLIPMVNEKFVKTNYSTPDVHQLLNVYLQSSNSSQITISNIWGVDNTWLILNKATNFYNQENIVGVWISRISPINFAYSNRNVLRKLFTFSKKEPWTTLNDNLYLGMTTVRSYRSINNETYNASIGVIVIDCLPTDIYLKDKPLFINKINTLLENANDIEHPPLIIKPNEPLLLSSSYLKIKYKADVNNETGLDLTYIDTRFMINFISINYFILQAMYIRLCIPNWNSHKQLSTSADEITVIDNKFVPSQTTAFANYIANSATTWDTQRKNATSTFATNLAATTVLSLFSIIAGIIGAVATGGASSGLIALGASGLALKTGTDFGKQSVNYSNTMRSINSEIRNKQMQPNEISLPSFAGGLSGSGLWNKNMDGLPLLTEALNPTTEDEVFSKRNIYGVNRFGEVIEFQKFNVRQHFNFIQVDTSYNLADIIATIKKSASYSTHYQEWVDDYIINYLSAGMLLMNEPIDDLLNDVYNYEWDYVTGTRINN